MCVTEIIESFVLRLSARATFGAHLVKHLLLSPGGAAGRQAGRQAGPQTDTLRDAAQDADTAKRAYDALQSTIQEREQALAEREERVKKREKALENWAADLQDQSDEQAAIAARGDMYMLCKPYCASKGLADARAVDEEGWSALHHVVEDLRLGHAVIDVAFAIIDQLDEGQVNLRTGPNRRPPDTTALHMLVAGSMSTRRVPHRDALRLPASTVEWSVNARRLDVSM